MQWMISTFLTLRLAHFNALHPPAIVGPSQPFAQPRQKKERTKRRTKNEKRSKKEERMKKKHRLGTQGWRAQNVLYGGGASAREFMTVWAWMKS
jgi:hypothetical protein